MNDYTNGKIRDHKTITLHVDGGCEPKNPGGVACSGWIMFDEQGNTLAKEGKVVADGGPNATNNYAEYCALGFALRWLAENNWCGTLHVKSDSKLVVHQVLEEWKCNKDHLKKLRARCWELMDQMQLYRCTPHDYKVLVETRTLDDSKGVATFQWVPREQNECADSLAGEAYEIYCRQHGRQARYLARKPKTKKEQKYKCFGCGHVGPISEIGIEDGNLQCPICETSGIQFL